MMEIFPNPGYDFIGKRAWTYALSGLVTLASLVSPATRRITCDP